MPSDSNGNYSLPAGYLANVGQTIQPAQHNPPLEDLAASMSQRVMASGATPFTGPLKLADGSVGAPSLTFNSAPGIGFYKTAAGGIGLAGAFLPGVPVGLVSDFAGPVAPAGWLFCFGQGLAVADYPALYGALGVTYGGTPGLFFLLPDLRGRVLAGRVDMGGIDAGVLSGGATLGALIGVQNVTLGIGDIPSHSHIGTTDSGGVDHTHNVHDASAKNGQLSGLGANAFFADTTVATSGASAYLHTHTFSTNSVGGGGAHTNVQPTIVLNKIIFAGV